MTKKEHIVCNRIVYDGVSPYNPGENLYLIKEGEIVGMDIGWQKVDDKWVAPQPPLETEVSTE